MKQTFKHRRVAVIHNLTGGGGLRVLEETNKILSRYYQIEVFSPPTLQNSQSSTKVVKVVNYLIYIYRILPEYYKKISKEINKSKFSAVIIHQDSYLKSPTSLFYLKTKNIYLLQDPPREFYEPIQLHAPLLADKIFNILRIPVQILDRIATKKATHIIVNSKFSKKRIDKIYGVSSHIIYPGTRINSKCKSMKKRREYCVSVGSFLPYKGHDLAISAIGLMKYKPKLIIIGSGRDSEKKKLIELAKTNNVCLEIQSNISDRQLNSIYRKSKVYVNAAYKEPFGITSLEAISNGMNLVTADDGGTKELKEFFKKNVLVVGRDPKSIAKGIEEMMTTQHKGQKIPKMFNWEYFTTQLMKKIEK